ncbi:helix-turn-helix transcriptional regulator [Corynebacterium sp.]|uniref:helix-turn-helix transcriptional regulator n=1 Tax=Corynebacterium sp. TaxID=1720 RepID=UPI0034A14562
MKLSFNPSEVAPLLGVSRSSVYEAIRNDTFPTQVIKVGGRYVIPAKPLLDLLGIDELPAEPTAA